MYGAFSGCSGLTSVTLGNGVKRIGESAFSGCDSLTSVTIGTGVRSIAKYAFIDCYSLMNIHFKGTISQWNDISFGWYWDYDTPEYTIYCTDGTITKDGTVTYYEPEPQPEGSQGLEYALNADGQSYSVVGIGTCTDTELVIPSMHNGLPITAIGDGAFASIDMNFNPREPYNIVSVKLPETIKMIGTMAFAGIPTLTNVEIPNSIEKVGTYAFAGSEMLEFTEYENALYLGNEDNPYLVLVAPKDTNIVTCEINNQTKVIVDIAFNGCYFLETVYVGNGVKYISSGAFMSCSLLKEVIFGENSALIGIGAMAFMGCDIAKIILPNTVESIGQYAFGVNESLTSITISNSLKTIDELAFSYCSSLEKIVIPESVEFIGEYAFEWCSALTIYCEAESQPNEWNVNWNSKGAYSGNQFIPVVWNYKPE